MAARILEFVVETIGIFAFVITPFAMVWGWIRWARREKRWTIPAISSLIAFALTTSSALLAIAASIYWHLVGGFLYYDPRLLRTYALGTLVSSLALVLALVGVWRESALRWHALVCSFGTLVYWFALAEAE